MTKKTIASVLMVALLLSVVGCKKPDENMDLSNSLESATQQKLDSSELTENIITKTEPRMSGNVLILADQSKKSLTYSTTSQISDENVVDVYLDENQNQFRFNQSGELKGYTVAKNSYDPKPASPITEAQADAIALKHISDLYGDILNGYVLDYCNDDGVNYDLLYVKKYGTDDFVKGESCLVSVYYDGTVRHSSITHVGRFDGFDEALLSNITIEQIQTYANQQIAAGFPTLVNSTVKEIWLRENDSQYYLSVHVDVEYINNNETISELHSIAYAL